MMAQTSVQLRFTYWTRTAHDMAALIRPRPVRPVARAGVLLKTNPGRRSAVLPGLACEQDSTYFSHGVDTKVTE